MGHATCIKDALQIVKEGGAKASFRKPGTDCPAGQNGVYGFPLETIEEEDIARFAEDHSGNQYDRGAILVMRFKGAILKGSLYAFSRHLFWNNWFVFFWRIKTI